jgi:transposase
VRTALRALAAERHRRLHDPAPAAEDAAVVAIAQRLVQLGAVGETTAWLLATELFGWRHFRNRRHVGGFVGLTPTPFQSGDGAREQGITRNGSRELRALVIELAWGWLRYQPQSALSQWYRRTYGGTSPRLRRIGIVALARKLLIALWRYVDQGVLPAGAENRDDGRHRRHRHRGGLTIHRVRGAGPGRSRRRARTIARRTEFPRRAPRKEASKRW